MSGKADIVVVGAGPAGMAAAVTASDAGAKVVVLDDQPRAGGQIYRNVGEATGDVKDILGQDYFTGAALVHELGRSSAKHIMGASVWQITPDRQVCFSVDGRAQKIEAQKIILATGAMERPMPFPGWTMPGIMNAGAFQIMLKSGGLVPEGRLVLAGSGPLLYLLALQLCKAGVDLEALVETTPASNRWKAARHVMGFAGSRQYLVKGAAMLKQLKASGIAHYRGARNLQAIGQERIAGLRFWHAGRMKEVACNLLGLHQGVVPNVQISRSLDAMHDWDEAQACWRPRLDETRQTTVPGIYVAGDGAGIAGAAAAPASGRMAALDALKHCGFEVSETELAEARRDYRRAVSARPFLDWLYRPADEFLLPEDNTTVCRCEEISAGEIRKMVKLGALGPNQAKAFCRAGMGPCQGRMCGLTVSNLIANQRGVSPAEAGYYRIRPPIKPVSLGELANLADGTD